MLLQLLLSSALAERGVIEPNLHVCAVGNGPQTLSCGAGFVIGEVTTAPVSYTHLTLPTICSV